MARKSKKNQISQDVDGTFFCLKCGKAGFANNTVAWGHLGQCKGFKSVSRKLNKEFEKLNQFQGFEQGDDLNNYQKNEVGLSLTPPTSSFEVHPQKEGGVGGGEALPEALPQALPQALYLTEKERYLAGELAVQKSLNQKLHKYAFNHVQHYQPASRITNPSDLLFSGINELAQNNLFRKLLALGALVFITVKAVTWLQDSTDKLSKRRK